MPSIQAGWPNGASPHLSIIQQTADFTVADNYFVGNVVVEVDSNASVNVTIPAGLNPASDVSVVRMGTGAVTFTAAPGVTLHSDSGYVIIGAQYTAVIILPTSTPDSYILIGNLSQV